MYIKMIKLPTIEAAKEFVARANTCSFDIDLGYDRVLVDAKSILGVLSLDLNRPLRVQSYGRDELFEAFLEEMNRKANYAA